MNLKTRIAEVESALGPQEAVILWMNEAYQFSNRIQYRRWLAGQPADAYPLVRMPEQVANEVERRLRGRPLPVRKEEIRRAHRQVTFLYFLHRALDAAVTSELEIIGLQSSLQAERLARLSAEQILGAFMADTWAEEFRLSDRMQLWREETGDLLTSIEVLARTASYVSHRYLGNEEPLFPARAQELEAMRRSLEGLFENYKLLGDCGPEKRDGSAQEPVGLEEHTGGHGPWSLTEKDIEPRVTQLVHYLSAMARAETLAATGDRDAAVDLVEDQILRPAC